MGMAEFWVSVFGFAFGCWEKRLCISVQFSFYFCFRLHVIAAVVAGRGVVVVCLLFLLLLLLLLPDSHIPN